MSDDYATVQPERQQIDSLRGPVVVEFGTGWCGYCQAAQPLIASAFAGHPEVKRLKVEDGPGRPLGRSFKVKLWPTLIFMRDGQEISRLVRPEESAAIEAELEAIEIAPGKEQGLGDIA